MTRLAVVYFEIDIDYCDNVYGTAPCTAALGVTGDRKCFNTVKTCQSRNNFAQSTVTLRFAKDCDYLPKDIRVHSASIIDHSYNPGTISLGEDLGIRSSVTVSFSDHPHSDAGAGFDKYHLERGYDPYSRGSFWGRFRARQPYMRGRHCRLIFGFVGQELAEMETHHLVIESFDGPTPAGRYTITAKDALKALDDDRAQAPVLSLGTILSDIASNAGSLQVTPSGVGILYPAAGYVAIGGKEIVSYTRPYPGIDANALLVMHFNGSNGATSTTDSSSAARTVTRNGDAQLATADKVFGTASSLFDGTGDYWSLADNAVWTFSGDFCLEARAKFSSLSSARTLMCHSTDLSNMYRLYVTTTGRLRFRVLSGGVELILVQTAQGVIETGKWYHLAVSREGDVFRLFVNGVVMQVRELAVTIPNFTSTFKVGISGDGSADPMHGYIDELRVSNVARYVGKFTPPDGEFSTSNGDVFTITRAQFNTTAIAHKAEDRVQLCLVYSGADPADILYDLLVNYAGLASAWCNLTDWKAETATYLGRVYTTCIPTPVGVKTLACEVLRAMGGAMWWLDTSEQVRLQVLRSIALDAETFDQSIFQRGSLQVKEQPDKRVSQCWTFYGQRNPLEPLENEDNYRSVLLTPDLQSEADNGSAMVKKIYSRWIPQFGKAIAERVNNLQLSRFKIPPRNFSFEVFRIEGRADPVVGGGYRVSDQSMQDDTGLQVDAPIQLTRVRPADDSFAVEAEEALFIEGDFDPFARNITIDANTFNFNLRSVHDTLFPVVTDPTGITLNVTINSGVVVGSTAVGAPAFTVGTFPVGLTINITNNGRIQGRGGQGGQGSNVPSAADPGGAGGPAFYTRSAINLTNNGQIWGGGGGGGGKYGGGGGGAGTNPGQGAPSRDQPGVAILTGGDGNAFGGGVGGTPPPGTDPLLYAGGGGAPGNAGDPGTYAGGAAGRSIDGWSYVTNLATGDRRGPTAN